MNSWNVNWINDVRNGKRNKTRNVKKNESNRGGVIDNISWFEFVTFDWVTVILNRLRRDGNFNLPKIEEDTAIQYYSYKLENNLRNGRLKYKRNVNSKVKKNGDHGNYAHDERYKEESCFLQKRGIICALLKTFKLQLSCISFFNIIHTAFLIFVALCIENYILLIKGYQNISIPFTENNKKIIMGFFLVLVICLNIFFDAILTFFDYRLRLNMEVTLMYFLYKINLDHFCGRINSSESAWFEGEDPPINDTVLKDVIPSSPNQHQNTSDKVPEKKDAHALRDQLMKKEQDKRVHHVLVEGDSRDSVSNDPTTCYPTACQRIPCEPAPNEPAPNEPAPNEPAPNEPAPNEPAPNEPAPNEAAPNEPRGGVHHSDAGDQITHRPEEQNKIWSNKTHTIMDPEDDDSNGDIPPRERLPRERQRVVARGNDEMGEVGNKTNQTQNYLENQFLNNEQRRKIQLVQGEGKIEADSCDISIYNIMFVDTPFLIYFINAMIDMCNMLIKFIISFYTFYYKMGSEAVMSGVLLILSLYSLIFSFELSSSLFKIKHLRCRDSRISNMHHILKEYKLIKMFNWESIAFDYVNEHRKKEMKFCKIRIYLSSLSNYINNISMNIIEVVIFFIFIRGELNSNKPINVSSIITPLFVYKSLISGMSNFPNIINNLLEGSINIGRINKYIQHYLFEYDTNEHSTDSSFDNNSYYYGSSSRLTEQHGQMDISNCSTNGFSMNNNNSTSILISNVGKKKEKKKKNYEHEFRKTRNTQYDEEEAEEGIGRFAGGIKRKKNWRNFLKFVVSHNEYDMEERVQKKKEFSSYHSNKYRNHKIRNVYMCHSNYRKHYSSFCMEGSTMDDNSHVVFSCEERKKRGATSLTLNSCNKNGHNSKCKDVILKMKNCYFIANKRISSCVTTNEGGAMLLKNINLIVKNNSLTVILGNVGSGKTLLFNSLLGNLKLAQGNYYIKNFIYDMPIMYVPQFTWVTIGTIRSMILFGNRFDPVLYYQVIEQSELLNDLNTFKRKDLRYINDEHSLSKGQKARICLARALYHHYIHMSDLLIDYENEINENNKCREEKVHGNYTIHSYAVQKVNSNNHKEKMGEEKEVAMKGCQDERKTQTSVENQGINENSLPQERMETHELEEMNNVNKMDKANNPTNNTHDRGKNTRRIRNSISHGIQANDIKMDESLHDKNKRQSEEVGCVGKGESNEANDVIIEPTEEPEKHNSFPFNNNKYIKECLEIEEMSYLYLLDDIFCSLDPCISKNIFYNLFCHKENVQGFKNKCSFVMSVNQNIWNSFLLEDIINNLQYEVEIYELQDRTLVYHGDIHAYMKKNEITIRKELPKEHGINSDGRTIASGLSHFPSTHSQKSTNGIMEFFEDQQKRNRRRQKKKSSTSYDMKYHKFMLLKELKSTYSCKLEPIGSASLHEHGRKYSYVTQNYGEKMDMKKMETSGNLSSLLSIGSRKRTMINNYAEFLVKQNNKNCSLSFNESDKVYLHEFENVNKILQSQLKENYACDYIGINENDEEEEEEFRFRGNIKWKTFIWYLKMIGKRLIIVIIFFMIISIFTDEIKNMLLFMTSTLIRNGTAQNDSEILRKQLIYLKYFVLLPSISLLTTLIAFMVIAHGIGISAVKVHTEVLTSILYAPIHAFYSNNLGNIINRFITDINVLDNGIIKRIYKTFYTFFRFLFTIFLLNYMVKHTIYVFPFILLLIYFFVFQKYSIGCKEAQRGYLCAHAPLCTIYSNTIAGKDIINMYKKNKHFMSLYTKRVLDFKNYTIFKWSLTIWASLYVQLIVLCLTSFYILYPYLILPHLGKLNDPNFMNQEANANIIGYCVTFSCSLGFIIKSLLYDYTHVEKEMCSTQRLEECSQMINENVGYSDEEAEEHATGRDGRTAGTDQRTAERDERTAGTDQRTAERDERTAGTDQMITADANPKAKYGFHFENVFVSYKKKIYIDKVRNVYYYANEKSCLRNINIYALKGQKVGIVGKSGAGKSTTFLSILGLISTTRGNITIEGRDIKSMSLEERKNTIGLLPQSSFVFFHWNVRTYIDLYDQFSDDEIIDAFKLIGINLGHNDLNKYIYKQKEKKKSNHGQRGGEKEGRKQKNSSASVVGGAESSEVPQSYTSKSGSTSTYAAASTSASASTYATASGSTSKSAPESASTSENFLSLSDDCIRYLALVRIYLNRHIYKLVLIDEIPVINLNLSNSNSNHFFSSNVKSFEYIISNYFKHITVLIIAHDVTTLSCCDFIYVMANGEVIYKCNYADIKTQAGLAALIQEQT
ncbi:multidrug resistance associated protein [Plasmodium gonderi]|uniref:Multidrug resistance associated protein n=1 Tax=Plasmodium gonderi TaxID=77519 RepID=A0A1Y1JR09_PLAGO|nr:multidrug resistance associated protein [Plasmodium gonderi]GAW83667.1 multidrug resistance associated protein [Plasmodium gonderi]